MNSVDRDRSRRIRIVLLTSRFALQNARVAIAKCGFDFCCCVCSRCSRSSTSAVTLAGGFALLTSGQRVRLTRAGKLCECVKTRFEQYMYEAAVQR
jgi:hypothetical protein